MHTYKVVTKMWTQRILAFGLLAFATVETFAAQEMTVGNDGKVGAKRGAEDGLLTDKQMSDIEKVLDKASEGEMANNLTAIRMTLQRFLTSKTVVKAGGEDDKGGSPSGGVEIPPNEVADIQHKLETVGALLRSSMDMTNNNYHHEPREEGYRSDSAVERALFTTTTHHNNHQTTAQKDKRRHKDGTDFVGMATKFDSMEHRQIAKLNAEKAKTDPNPPQIIKLTTTTNSATSFPTTILSMSPYKIVITLTAAATCLLFQTVPFRWA